MANSKEKFQEAIEVHLNYLKIMVQKLIKRKLLIMLNLRMAHMWGKLPYMPKIL